MTHKHRRRFAFALVVCLLFGLLPGVSQAEQTQTPPVADAYAAETPLDAVPATQTPTELTEAETVSLSKDQVRVIKGGTTTLTAEIPEDQRGEASGPLTTSSAIVWTSSNPAVATVDSNGVVTGVELGEATITATLNGSVIETFSVYSTLADGYYRIDNPSNTYCFYPSAISMYYSVDVNIVPLTYLDDALSAYYGELQRKWYIEYLDNGYYAIHPAYSSGMVLSLFGGTIPILQQADSTTLNYWQWSIVSSSGDYAFVNRYYSDQAITFPDLDDTLGPLTSDTYTSSSTQKWSLVSTTVSPGLLLFDMRSGDLVGDDLYYNSYEVRPDDVGVYVGVCLNQAYSLDELGLYLQPLEIGSYSRAHTMTFSQTYATFNLSTLKITGTQTGYTDAEVKRAISGTLYKIILRIKVKEMENLTVKYDYAYANRYSAHLSRINQQTQVLTQKFRKEYNIFLNISTPILFTSYGDMCPHSSNYMSYCNCGGEGACSGAEYWFAAENMVNTKFHHKNAYNILYADAEDIDTKTIAYTGHNVCRVGDPFIDENGNLISGHTINGQSDLFYLKGCAPFWGDNRPEIALVANHLSLDSSQITTVHEFGHLFEIRDHYSGSQMSTDQINNIFKEYLEDKTFNEFSDNCIYGSYKNTSTITNSMVICEGCRKLATGQLIFPDL